MDVIWSTISHILYIVGTHYLWTSAEVTKATVYKLANALKSTILLMVLVQNSLSITELGTSLLSYMDTAILQHMSC